MAIRQEHGPTFGAVTARPLTPGDLLHCPHCHRWRRLALKQQHRDQHALRRRDAVLGLREGSLLRGTDRRVESVRHSFSHRPIVGYDQVMPKTDRDQKPSIAWDELVASTTERPVHPNIHESIIQAIQNKNFVTLIMHGHEMSGEPHVYGMRGGHPMLLLYNEETDPKWNPADVGDVEQVKIWLDEHFNKRELPAEYDPDKN